MGSLIASALTLGLIVALANAFLAAGVAALWCWRRPDMEFRSAMIKSGRIVPAFVGLLFVILIVLESFNSDPVTGPQAQGFVFILIGVAVIVLLGMAINHVMAWVFQAMVNRT